MNNFLEKMFFDEEMTPDEREIVQYGMEYMAETLLGFFLTILISSFFQGFSAAVMLCALLLLLRGNAGGYHAKTPLQCKLISVLALLAAHTLVYSVQWPEWFHIVPVIGGILLLWFLAPIDSENKPLDETERRVYRKRTHIILLVEMSLFLFGQTMHLVSLCRSVEISVIIVTALVTVGACDKMYQKISWSWRNEI